MCIIIVEAGDGAVPHTCIGRARRMMVANRDRQHEVLIEAVQNASRSVIVVDEIGTKQVSASKRCGWYPDIGPKLDHAATYCVVGDFQS